MRKEKQLTLWAAALIGLILASQSMAQYRTDPDAAAKIRAATQPVTLVGKIGYNPRYGGYYLMNNPDYNFGDKIILNQNRQVLKKLKRRGKAVTIKGRVDPKNLMASHIVIESINGKHYRGQHPPVVSPW